MLKLFKDVTSGSQWATFYKYDSNGQVIWQAMPSAVLAPSGSDIYDAHNDLLKSVSGNYQYPSDSTGLILITDYASSTTATASTPGNVQDFKQPCRVGMLAHRLMASVSHGNVSVSEKASFDWESCRMSQDVRQILTGD